MKIKEKSDNYDEDIKLLLQQLKNITEKEHRIKLAYENGIDTIDEYKENKERIKKEKEKTEEELKKLKFVDNKEKEKNKIYKKCEEAYKILNDDNASEDLKFTISHELFDKIVYDKEKEELIIFYK